MIRFDAKQKLGEMTITREREGETENFTVNIYGGNCLAIFVYEYTDENGVKMAQLWNFIADGKHASNIIKSGYPLLDEDVTDIKLNIAFKDAEKLLKILVKAGYNVNVHYKA